MKLNYDKAQLEAVVDKVAERTMNMDMTWDWPCGVAYYGITEAYEATGNKKYLDMVKERVDELISLGLPDFTVNTCAMGHVLLTLYKETGDETYKKIIDDKLDYLTNHALRFGDHAIRNLQTVIAKKAFVGCSGIDAVMGMTTENANEVTINQLMVRNVAKDAYILADHTKLGQISSFISCPIEEIHYLITDELAPAEAVEELRAKGVRVHQVKKADFPNEGLINQTEKKGK